MYIYCITAGMNGWDMYCQYCIDYFLQQGGDEDTVDGPYEDGGGEADAIRHCDLGDKCARAMQTKDGLVGVCFENDLTSRGVDYTLDALETYVVDGHGNSDVLDLWSDILHTHAMGFTNDQALARYDDYRAREKGNALKPLPRKRDTKVNSLMAFFDDRPAVSEATYCKSCRDTGIIVLFNSSVECTDCSKSLKNVSLEGMDISF